MIRLQNHFHFSTNKEKIGQTYTQKRTFCLVNQCVNIQKQFSKEMERKKLRGKKAFFFQYH